MPARETEVDLRPRPAVRDRAATRRRLLEAARDLFGEHGYDEVTVRMIAAAAGVNVALVNRYFGSKAALFGEVLANESALGQVLAGDPAGLPRRLARHVVRQVREGPASPVLRSLDRSAGHPEVGEIMRHHLNRVLIDPLAAALGGGPDARDRAATAALIVLGIGPTRRLLGLADLRAADPATLTDRLTAMFEAALGPPTSRN